MSKISSLAKSAVVVLIAGVSLIYPTRIQTQTLGDAPIPQPEPTNTPLEAIPIPITPPSPAQPSVLPPSQQVLTDNLISQVWWQQKIKSQVRTAHKKQYDACLFGDSISSGIGNTLGDGTFNFALGGMSTVSLIEQLKSLSTAKLKCSLAVIAVGTNDADYNITNDMFLKNMKQSIALVKSMGADNVYLVPAFYSTTEASNQPRLAGSLARVEEINALIRQVAAMEKVVLFEQDIQPLYQGQALRKDLTTDGVHLNAEGKKIYRHALSKLLSLRFKGCD